MPAAWTVARQSGEHVLPSQWRCLADRHGSHDPLATIPVYRRLVAETLTAAGAQNYRDAIELLKKLRSTSRAAGDESFDDYLLQLRLDQRNRPTFQKIQAAARLD